MIWSPWRWRRLRKAMAEKDAVIQVQRHTIHKQGDMLKVLDERLRPLESTVPAILAPLAQLLPEYAEKGFSEAEARKAILRAFEELKQLRRKGMSAYESKALELFRKTGKAEHLEGIPGGHMAGQNAQATEVKFRMVKDVNRGLRVAIRNIIVNLAYARTLKHGNNARGEIEIFTLTEALTFTDLGDLGSAERLGKKALTASPESRGFEAPDLEVIDGGKTQ